MCIIAAAFGCTAAIGSDTSEAIPNEGLRIAALHAIFPGMQISMDRRERINGSSSQKPGAGEILFPDALAGENSYRVVGQAMNEAERCASQNVVTLKSSDTRRVRFTVFRWPTESDGGLLAVLQYDFPGANPTMACPSLGLLVHLVRNSASWSAEDEYLLETQHHFSLQEIRLLDLTGKGANELVVESSYGGAGTAASTLQVFDLSRGHFDEVLRTASRMEYMTDDYFTQVLDISRTRASRGQRFCLSKKALFENGKSFQPPRVTHPCYARGDGVDASAPGQRNDMLTPLH